MSNLLEGKYTIEQVLNFTYQKFGTRFEYSKRDKVKVIKIKTIQFYSKDRKKSPTKKYIIESSSLPQYTPYASGAKDKRGRKRYRQHSVRHNYDTVFQFGEEGITLTTKQWKSVTGSLRKLPKKIPQDKVGQIHKETREKWKKRYKGDELKKKIRSHKRKAKYISDGDYIAQELGINLDFLYRQAYAYYINGHLYGRNYNGNIPSKKTNPQNIVFFNKHQIRIIKVLMQKGILTR